MSSKLCIPNDVLETIVCLNCSNYLSIFPIYTKTDSTGAICGRCKLVELDKYIRDEAYEGIAQFLIFPCKHANNGCKEHLTPPKLEDHERCCAFRKFDCPSNNYSKCQWKGARIDLIEHFNQTHADILLKDPSFPLNFINSQEEYLLLPHNEELFVIKKEVDARKGIFSCAIEHLKAMENSDVYLHYLKIESGNKNYFYKCPDKSTCDNEKLNSTQLTHDILRERLHDPASMVVNIKIFKSTRIEVDSTEEAGDTITKPISVKNNPNVNWDLLSELECPICFDFMLPPIYQCINGHSICVSCKPKVKGVCPVCKNEIQDTKNFVLEKMTQHIIYPCKFHKSGCQYSCKSTEIKNHENYCEFGPYECPLKDLKDCKWKASHAEVAGHIDNNHNDFILRGDKLDIPFSSNQQSEKIVLIQYKNKIFKVFYRFENEKFFWCVQLVGPADEAKKYSFEIDVIDLSCQKQRFYLSGTVVPLSPQDECFTQKRKYVTASLEQLESFITTIFSFRVRVVQE